MYNNKNINRLAEDICLKVLARYLKEIKTYNEDVRYVQNILANVAEDSYNFGFKCGRIGDVGKGRK